MSAFVLISFASPPGADLPGDAPVRLVLTRLGHPTSTDSAIDRTWKPTKIGTTVTPHGRYTMFRLVEVVVDAGADVTPPSVLSQYLD